MLVLLLELLLVLGRELELLLLLIGPWLRAGKALFLLLPELLLVLVRMLELLRLREILLILMRVLGRIGLLEELLTTLLSGDKTGQSGTEETGDGRIWKKLASRRVARCEDG